MPSLNEKIRCFFSELTGSEKFRLYFCNSFWLMAARFAWIFQAVTIGIYMARVLGPYRLGQLNYSISLIGLLCVLITMQCRDVLVRHLIRTPKFHNLLIGTNCVFKLLLFTLSAILFFIALPGITADREIRTMLLILLGQQFFIAFAENFEIHFIANSQNRFDAFSQLLACLVYSGLRLWAAWVNADVYVYAWIELSGMAVKAAVMIFFYGKSGFSVFRWRFDKRLLKKIVLCALPFFGATLIAACYSRTDIVMLQMFRGTSDVGFYSLSAKLTENMTLLIGLLVSVFTPVVFMGAQESEEAFRKQLHRLYSLVFWVALFTAVVIFLLCGVGIRFLYGDAYMPTVSILRVFIFTVLYYALSSVLNLWAVKTNRLILSGLLNASGLLINVPLNYFMIRKFGAVGAAWASLISAPVGALLVMSFFPAGRKELFFILRSIATKPSFKFSR